MVEYKRHVGDRKERHLTVTLVVLQGINLLLPKSF